MVSVNVHCKLIACMTVHRNCNHARVTNVFIKKLKCLSKHFDLLTIWIDKSSSSYRRKKKKKTFFLYSVQRILYIFIDNSLHCG